MKDICYLCGKELAPKGSNSSCVCHDEHIIPNAIGGSLKTSHVLCKNCGSKYGDNEDSAFVSIFNCFIGILEDIMHFDRNHKGVVSYAYYCNDGNKEMVKVNHDSAFKSKPYHIIDKKNKTIKIYGHQKTTKFYRNKFNAAEYKDFTIQEINNIEGVFEVFFSENNGNFNNDFKNGFVKIAVEYALHCGVSREKLNLALTINEDNSSTVLFDKIAMFPYVPCNNPLAIIFEEYRPQFEEGYPSHSLRLFNIDKYLFCYVGLFSTFQYYLLLSDNYEGEKIDEYYWQSVLEIQRKKHEYTKEEVEQCDPSDLSIILSELGIDTKGISYENAYSIVNATQKSKFDNQFKWVIEKAFNAIIQLCEEQIEIEDCDVIGTFQQIASTFGMQNDELLEFTKANNSFDDYLKYNILLEGNEKIFDNCACRSNERYANNREYVTQHTQMKFKQFEDFCNNHKLENLCNDYLTKVLPK